MDSKIELELNKKLAEWAGFTSIEVYNDGFVGYTPTIQYDSHIPLFTQSLDACFKWLVPKVIDGVEKDSIEISILCPMIGYEFWVVHIRNRRVTIGQASADTTALALCLAISKLIEGEKNDK